MVIDERYEISAAEDGIVRRQIGFLTDTVCGLDKARAIELATRTLSPQLILCDEIGNEEEVERIHAAFANGIAFIVSVHCGDAEDLFQNRIIQKLMACHAFQTLVLLVGAARPGTVERIISREEYYAQSGGNPFR